MSISIEQKANNEYQILIIINMKKKMYDKKLIIFTSNKN